MGTRRITRRTALKIGAAAAGAPLVHVRRAGAAGKLSVGFWDHWVPQGNDVMRKQIQAWADQNKVELQADFITSNGNKLQLTKAAEAQAGAGHDFIAFSTWEVHQYADRLEPVDDVMRRLTTKYGRANEVCEYLGKIRGHWMAVPTSSGTQNKGPCGRISVLREKAGLDVVKMYPATESTAPQGQDWTWDAHLRAATACHKAAMPFGIGLGTTTDSVDTAGALFAAYGAELVDAKGDIKVKSEEVHRVLEFGQKLVKVLPPDAPAYDDASNNRALISGKSALIWNPPSAWAVAKRDAPEVAADCWTFSPPAGPKGRFTPYLPYFWGIWSFSKNKAAAKDLIEYLLQRPLVEARCSVVEGYDIPPFISMLDFKVWAQAGPPPGTLYNYPIRLSHHARPHITASESPPEMAVQIYSRGTHPTMLAKLMSGQTIEQVIAWAQTELEGFRR